MQVRIISNLSQKYVLVRAVHRGEEELLLWGDSTVEWHKEIIEKIIHAGYEIIEVLGGGWLHPRLEEKVTYVWGRSDRLGAAPINLVRKLLGDEVIEHEPE